MKFTMNVVKNGKDLKWTYDNEDNSVYDENGVCLNPEPMFTTREFINKPFTKENNPNIKTNDTVTTLEIMLGFNCNLKCDFCQEEQYKDRVYSSTPKDVEGIIAKLHKLDFKNIISIELWGGEPLVYWKTYKLLVPELRKMYPNAYISTFTNGVLLDKEKVDFFKENRVNVVISCDNVHANANKTGTKYSNILEDENILKAIRYFHEVAPDLVSFWATLVPGHVDFEEIRQDIINKTGLDNIEIDYLPIKCVTINDVFTHDEYLKVLDQYYQFLMGKGDSASARAHENMFMNRVLSKMNRMQATSHCNLGFTRSVAFTLDGTVYNCYIRPQAIGKLDNLKQLNITGLTHWSEREYCNRCPWIQCCGGVCYTIPNKRHRYTCGNFRAYVEAMFKSVIAKLFGVYFKSMEYEDSDLLYKLAEEKSKTIKIVPTNEC